MDHVDAISREVGREHVGALNVLRHTKNVLIWLALVSVALHIVSWVVVCHTDMLDPLKLEILRTEGNADQHASLPTQVERDKARSRELMIESSLALSGFVGRAAVFVLTCVLVLALIVSLSARLGGAAWMTKSCVWSLAALAMLVPWDLITRSDAAALTMPSAFFSVAQLNEATSGSVGFLLQSLRFFIYPMLVAAFLIASQISFRRAYRAVTAAPAARLPIREL